MGVFTVPPTGFNREIPERIAKKEMSMALYRPRDAARTAWRSPPVTMRERDFAQAVVDLAVWCGWRVYRTWNSRHSPRGFPDVVLVRPPAVVIAELKSDCGRVSPAQGDWLEDLAQCPGIEVYLWRPADWDAIAARLQRR